MNKSFRLMLSAALLGVATASFASLTFYSSRASFNAAIPGATLENFELGAIGFGGAASCPSPLDKNSNNGVFSPGFTDFFLGNGWGPYTTIGLSSVYTGTGIAMESTDPNIHSVGLDILQNFGSGDTVVSIYSTSGLLNSEVFSVTDWQGTFYGFSSTDVITKVVVYDGQIFSGYDGVDNVAFAQAVPEPASLLGMGAGLVLMLRRRRR